MLGVMDHLLNENVISEFELNSILYNSEDDVWSPLIEVTIWIICEILIFISMTQSYNNVINVGTRTFCLFIHEVFLYCLNS